MTCPGDGAWGQSQSFDLPRLETEAPPALNWWGAVGSAADTCPGETVSLAPGKKKPVPSDVSEAGGRRGKGRERRPKVCTVKDNMGWSGWEEFRNLTPNDKTNLQAQE